MNCPDCDKATLIPITFSRGGGGTIGAIECSGRDCNFSATISDRRWIEAALLSHKDKQEDGE